RVARQRREASSPLVVFGKRGNLDLLLAVDAAAERLRLTAGLPLAQGRALHPTFPAVAQGQAAAAPPPAALCPRRPPPTPLVAVDPPDGVLLDIGGCAHLFGGEANLRGDLLARMTRFGFSARAAIAATIGAASAAARFGDATTTGANRGERERLAPLLLA